MCGLNSGAVMTDTPTPDTPAGRADRLVAARRWTHGDIDLLQRLLDGGPGPRAALIAEDPSREKPLRSLLVVGLAAEGADGSVALSDEGAALAPLILERLLRRKARATARNERHAESREKGETVKAMVAAAVAAVFPAIPAEVAEAVALRIAPGVTKAGGRRPGFQTVVDAVAAIRFERWRQAVAAETEVAKRLEAMTARGDNNRARKRYRDQRAVDRVQAELAAWRGELGPVETRRLG
jgi:hypothetical protein